MIRIIGDKAFERLPTSDKLPGICKNSNKEKSKFKTLQLLRASMNNHTPDVKTASHVTVVCWSHVTASDSLLHVSLHEN